MKPKALRNAALEYADRGWHVVPLRRRGKEPLGQLVPNGLKQATSDLAMVLRWWTRAPSANVGIVAEPSGLVVLDVDPRNGGDDALHDLERELGALPETVRAETGGGGAHYLFRHPGGDLLGQLWPASWSREERKASGVDVKAHGYIVAPPSIHPSGRPYEWDLAPDDVEMAELPERWLERLRPTVARRTLDLNVNLNHGDPLRSIPASAYVPRLSGRELTRSGWVRCPFHSGGAERQPSLSTSGTLWACYGCLAPPGKRVMGGNIYDFAGLLAGFAIPLRGPDFLEVQARLRRALIGAG